VVTGGGVKVVPITYSNKDFQFLEMSRWTRDRILGCYRVPAGKLGLFEDINRANQKGLDITFNSEAIRPRLDLWQGELTKQLIWSEFSDKIEMKFDNPVPRDREMDLKETELREGKYSVNEIRNMWDGAPPVAGGDTILIDSKKIPLTSAGKVELGTGGGDDTPEYDTENDPGGDESEKQLLLDVDWNKAFDPLFKEYKKTLDHTHGWSYKKAEKFAREDAEFNGVDGKIKDLFVDSIKNGVEVADFKRRTMDFLAEKVAKKLNEREKEGSHSS
jgi:hypothetical protein